MRKITIQQFQQLELFKETNWFMDFWYVHKNTKLVLLKQDIFMVKENYRFNL